MWHLKKSVHFFKGFSIVYSTVLVFFFFEVLGTFFFFFLGFKGFSGDFWLIR